MTVSGAKIGDLFTSQAQTLVNTVNCVGVMGKGIALEFKQRFPDMYKDYVDRCNSGQVRLGRPYLYKRLIEPWILNFPTKDHWRAVSRLSDIVAGLEYLARHYKQWGITSLAVPPLGCGNGQLDWNVVGPTLYLYLDKLDIPVEMYAPRGTPPEQLATDFLARGKGSGIGDPHPVGAHLPPEAIALVGVVSRVTREPHHWPVGRTTFQKIAYFLTEAGIPTGLHYERGSFGPFSPEIKRLIGRLMNHNLVTEQRRGQMFEIALGPTYPDARTLYMENLRAWAPAIERVADLFLRMPRTHDAEIAATVHFAAKDLQKALNRRPSECEVLEEVKRWKVRRRPPLSDREIAETIRHLNLLGWIDLEASPDLPVEEDELLYA
jgi:O-acetyl-ADP-ribose deacetylase (regulator of RNase III)